MQKIIAIILLVLVSVADLSAYFDGEVESLKPYQDQNKTYNFDALTTDYRGDFGRPRVSTTLKFKGNLRISWSFDIKHNKNIDLIFFPQNNPYINYAVLYAKDFSKNIDDESFMPQALKDIKIPYDINYDFVKGILSKTGFSESQQQRFFDSRFGSVLVPIEVEFEWYAISLSAFNTAPLDFSVITFPKYDKYIRDNETYPDDGFTMIVGIIKSHKILPQNTSLDFSQAEIIIDNKPKPFTALFAPLPTSALAITKTNINDFIINVRDKPDSKEGKIVAQLLSQTFSYDLLKPKYQKLQQENGWGDEVISSFMDKEMEKHYKSQQSYYESNKQKLINPLWRDDYLVLVWDILPNDWCKVWILKMIDKNTMSNEDNETKFSEVEFDLFGFRTQLLPFIDNYAKTFNKTPSTLKLYEGYIHSSGLEYLAPFGKKSMKD